MTAPKYSCFFTRGNQNQSTCPWTSVGETCDLVAPKVKNEYKLSWNGNWCLALYIFYVWFSTIKNFLSSWWRHVIWMLL